MNTSVLSNSINIVWKSTKIFRRMMNSMDSCLLEEVIPSNPLSVFFANYLSVISKKYYEPDYCSAVDSFNSLW